MPQTFVQRLFRRRRRSSMPFMVRAHYPRELRSWSLLGVALGAVEGGIVGVLVKNIFEGQVSAPLLNTAVALVTGAPALANMFSFFWASASHGKDKIRFLLGMQVACMLAILAISFAPVNAMGLLLVVIATIAARACWAGVITVRTQVWRANYPRRIMANMTGRLVTAMAMIMGSVGIVLGYALTNYDDAFRYAYPALAGIGLMGALTYRRMRVRRQKQLLAAENRIQEVGSSRPGILKMVGVLKADADFRRYMKLMFMFGSGNLMVLAPLILILNDRYALTQLNQMLITSSIPLLMMPVFMGVWARLLDRGHVVHYRSRQAWSFVVTFIVWGAAAVFDQGWLLWLGAALYGISKAGGVLGWNLGHHDFATPELATQYMGTHVTLTGIRGLLAPLVGVWLYDWMERQAPGSGRWILLLPLALSTTGAIGFVRMSRQMRAREQAEGKN